MIRRYTIFSVVYGCETWSLTLKKERRLRVNITYQLMHFYIQ